ncbi:pimeloyl-ACP methyl ester carboxylesterase [Crossiella equi]|uniref:Pimeloyl-ACP methyl ester carboxylesterase n=1 Tax=Crossiella equi TaxID=130796 RepID=A0ABS5A8C0_9PSEU|nr:pimeloyl-ACP methyl ester carboxylesterase [Crossiella equi]
MIPFRINVPDAELAELTDRLRRTRWPDAEPVEDWSQGVPLGYLRELCEYWATGYDWRATERRLNAIPQFRTEIDGVGIHFLHVRSPHPEALPLVLTHGWPGSVLEFEKAIRPLTEPADPADAFHVVIPSLPGYGFSDRPTEPGWTVQRIAAAWRELMARLGYRRYGAQGSDWGTSVTTSMGQQDTGQLAGIHVMPPIAAPDPATFDDLTPAERAALADLRHAEEHESGYAGQMTTKPQTVGYALTDSPAGLCAWIVEKFASWTDSGGRPETVLTRDEMLDDISLYWFTRTAASSARLYWESFREVGEWFSTATRDTVPVPTGCSVFPKEMPRPSRRWAANRYPDIRHWGEPARGGHFAAFEQPELFVEELRAFFRLVR